MTNQPASEQTWPFRRLPNKILYRGLELSNETEWLLDEAMVRLNVGDPNKALKAALELFLATQPANENA